MQSAQKVNSALREVCNNYLGAQVILSKSGPLARSHKLSVRGEIISVTAAGVLVAHPRGAGREYASFTDLYSGHIQITVPVELAEDIANALERLGVHHREHRLGREGVPVLPVGPSADGVKRTKRLVG